MGFSNGDVKAEEITPINRMKGWSGRRVTVDVRPCPCGTLWVAEVRTHFLFGSFGIFMFGLLSKRQKK